MGSWKEHYDRLDDGFELFRREAEDYCRRLERLAVLDRSMWVLDFGCGSGYVAELIAPRVTRLYLWDVAPSMRQKSRRRLAGARNVVVLERPQLDPPDSRIHAILVNSVAQYMSQEEFRDWLGRWKRMLLPGGRIVVSDILPPRSSFVMELVESLLFAARHGLLFRSIAWRYSELKRYSSARAASPLLRMDREGLSGAAAGAGLDVEFAGENLTHRRNRITAVFRLL